MKVRDIMTTDVATATPETTLEDIATMMRDEDTGAIPVLDDDELVGIITDRDIVIRCIAQGKGGDARVRDAMTRDVKYCFERDDLEDVMENMAEIQVRRLPVLNADKRLIGIISLADAARMHSPDTVGIAFSGVVTPGGYHAGDAGRA